MPTSTCPTSPPAAAAEQGGFAARIMSKYGWTKGTGLHAGGEGITTALRVQVERRRRRADADGGGFAEPGGRGAHHCAQGAAAAVLREWRRR